MSTGQPPSLRVERELLSGGLRWVAGTDEVGRGALGGPVTAGVVVVDADTGRIPRGLRDSKLLAPAQREALVAPIRRWAVACAVGHASAAEIDRYGILAALRLAGERALVQLGVRPGALVLDGNYDWYTRPHAPEVSPLREPVAPVVLRVKADLVCASVAAASVLAKVERDALMREMASVHDGYGWHANKGYATPEHLDALRRMGPCAEHRRSWRLPIDDGSEQLVLDGTDRDPSAAQL